MTPKTSPIAKTLKLTKLLMLAPHTYSDLRNIIGGDVGSLRRILNAMVEAEMVRRHKAGPGQPSLSSSGSTNDQTTRLLRPPSPADQAQGAGRLDLGDRACARAPHDRNR